VGAIAIKHRHRYNSHRTAEAAVDTVITDRNLISTNKIATDKWSRWSGSCFGWRQLQDIVWPDLTTVYC